MPDTYTTIWNRLLLRAPSIGAALSQDLTRDVFNQLMERREWSWLMKSGSFFPSIFYQTGSVSISPNGQLVTGTGTAWTVNMTGSQFRPGAPPSNYSTYTILQVLSPTLILIDQPWSGPPISQSGYQIFQCYFTVPSDFNYFYSIINPTANYRLYHNLQQSTLDMADPQRVQTGIVFAAAFYDYTQNFSGSILPSLQVAGTQGDPAPVSSTSLGFSYPSNSTYIVQITTGGAPGGALVFAWAQDAGSFTTNVGVPDNNALNLSNGVQVYFPQATYVQGDVFIINCVSQATTGLPRYELWPRPVNCPFQYPYQYAAKLPALSDENPALPYLIAQRGDVLLEMALASCARYPGTDTARNPYYDLSLAVQHETRSERMIYELEKKDDDLAIKDLTWQNLDYAPCPFMDGSWLQRHAIYPG